MKAEYRIKHNGKWFEVGDEITDEKPKKTTKADENKADVKKSK